MGDFTPSPHWSTPKEPTRVITDPAEVEVVVPKEVKRFRIGLRPGRGLTIVLTDASTARVKREVEKAGDDAWYAFDGQECVILVPEKTVPLTEYQP